jgi:hypothetical protein
MIPPQLHASCASPGERELFYRLRDDPGTADWIVLHSLDVAKHRRQVSGEIDFVVVVPTLGVLCIEVKACHELRRQDGLWFYGTSQEGDPRGPFKQVSESMHSIRERIARGAPGLSGVVFWSCVIFPYIEFGVESAEWHQWQVVDRRALSLRPVSVHLTDILRRARTLLGTTVTSRWFDPASSAPDERACEALVRFLRPDFELYESPRARIQEMDAAAKRYTDEQLSALDAMNVNPRVVFEGPAGTGKTLLAIEAARRAAEAGRRVLLLCFNRFLGTWLDEQVGGLGPRVTSSTLHKYMLRVAGRNGPPPNADAGYWESVLPTEALEQLFLLDDERRFDEVIVDEAQDILRDNYMDVLDLCVRGGLAAGRWRLFGDFESQSIFSTDRGDALFSRLADRVGMVPRFSLRTNCRNTPRIAELVHVLGGLTPPYQRVLRPDDGVEPEVIYYENADEQAASLDRTLSALWSDGFRGSDVVVLSPRAAESCTATSIALCERLRPLSAVLARSPHPGFCSIHAFKGMESRAVVVTDIEEVGTPQAMTMFYIATTRALHRLVILAHARVRGEARSLVRRHLSGAV